MFAKKLTSLATSRGFFLKRYFSLSPMRVQEVKGHRPDNLEKKFLVWTGKYKTVEDVPSHVSRDEMERCRNRIRIRLANIMMALTVVGCIVMVFSGKAAAGRGESVAKQNLEWHKQYNQESAKKE